MKKLYIITLEPIEKRYTAQWHRYWKPEFSKYFNVEYIDGRTITDKIEAGRFLDINQTNMWKAVQIQVMSEMFFNNKIKEGDIFLFMDGWHFGITALKYMAQLNNIPIKIFAYWHAGTYDEHDFISQAGLGKWAKFNEIGWFKACDGHFVATEFHKQLIWQAVRKTGHVIERSKLHVVGFPMDFKKTIDEVLPKKDRSVFREDNIVFPHRMDKEKNPDTFDKLNHLFPDYTFIKTLTITKNKKEYYELLSKSKISFSASLQETFGIGTVEAMFLGCVPLVPRRLSYVELYDGLFLYSDMIVMKKKLKKFMRDYNKPYLKKALKNNIKRIDYLCKTSFKKMANIMRK